MSTPKDGNFYKFDLKKPPVEFGVQKGQIGNPGPEFSKTGFTLKVTKPQLFGELPPRVPILFPPKTGSKVYTVTLFGGYYEAVVESDDLAVTAEGTRILIQNGADGFCEVGGHITKGAWELGLSKLASEKEMP